MDNRLQQHEFGFWEVVVKPSESELTNYYEKKYFQSESGNYRKEYSPIEQKVQKQRIQLRTQIALEFCQQKPVMRLLDVGCGEGFVLDHFDSLGWEVEGIDHSKAGVQQMNPHLANKVRQGNIFDLLNDCIDHKSKYDVLWLGNVLEHVIDPVELMKSLRKIVSKDGLLVITVPNDASKLQEMLFEQGKLNHRFWIAIPDHLSYFSGNSLKLLAANTNWNCVEMLADFPVDLFLANEKSNYVNVPELGPFAHAARLLLEEVIGNQKTSDIIAFYRSLANMGLGRNLIAYFKPNA